MTESNGDDASKTSPETHSKKRRIPGACDICKRKKVRCDSGTMPDNRCSNCLQFGYVCTHRKVTKAFEPAKFYIESLEARLEKMDKLLSKFLPNIDVSKEVDRIDEEVTDSNPVVESSEIHAADEVDLPSIINIRRLDLNPQEHIFYGKSSGLHLVRTALDLRQEYTGDPIIFTQDVKRAEFWHIPKWATKNPALEEHWLYIYPDADLIPSLIDAYFLHFNIFMPLLHRPTFEKSVAEGLHFKDSMFGATLLLVCAHGSRYSEDPRVLAEGSDSPRSAGWKWFEQVNVFRRTLYQRTTLYELQMHALHILFAQSSETPEGIWSQVGLALRLSQEVGAHRRRQKKDVSPSAENELWKRAFWVLLSLDRFISSLTGRPCSLNDEDFDLDFPIECDDEYWDNEFQQPSEKPSLITYFNCSLRLMDLFAYAMRLIYPIRRPNDKFVNVPPRSDEDIIAQLDSAMNNWMDTIPSHLRWNPTENTLFLPQSAVLYATYYHLQIFIHRPFIPSPRNHSRATFPSLTICTNAARSCCHVLESFTKWSAMPFVSLQISAFISAVILLLNIWSGKRSGHAPNPHREMQGVQRCMEILKVSERSWASAGRYGDILRQLACAGDLSILDNGQCQEMPRKKRPRDADNDSSDICPPDLSRSMAGKQRVSTSVPSYVQQRQQLPNFSLPMYSNELGRLPVYGQFQFSDTVHSIPVQSSLDDFVGLIPGPMGTSYDMQGAFATNPLFEDQMMGNLVVDHNPGTIETSSDFAALCSKDAFDMDSLSSFGATPTMDNTTMAVWSAAPTNFEMEDWRSYIHSFEQMIQAQPTKER